MPAIQLIWKRAHNSLWFLPAVMTIAAATLAGVTLWIDRHMAGNEALWFLFSAGSEGARGVLATIAGSIITVTGVVFSITIVALQLASSQFTPRVLRSFTGDRANQLVLGVFIATFTYALLVLRTVRSPTDDYDRFVPSLSVTCALLLCLVSIGFLIFFINHIARSIQAEVILARVTRDASDVVAELFPDPVSAGADSTGHEFALQGPSSFVIAPGAGYLQAIDVETIVAEAARRDCVFRMEVQIGAFVMQGDRVISVWPAQAVAETDSAVCAAITVGEERTNHQDVSRGLIELTDIGVRSLSPGVNDPTTAIVSIDRLAQVVVLLGNRALPDHVRRDSAGHARLILRPLTFSDIAIPPFAALRHHGCGDPAVAIRLIETLGRVIARVPKVRRDALRRELNEVVAAASRNIESTEDLRRLHIASHAATAEVPYGQ